MYNPQSTHPDSQTINDAVTKLLTTGDRSDFESLPQETQIALTAQSSLVATALFEPHLSGLAG